MSRQEGKRQSDKKQEKNYQISQRNIQITNESNHSNGRYQTTNLTENESSQKRSKQTLQDKINKIKAQYGKELSSKDGRKTKENEKNSSTSQKINNYRVVSQNESSSASKTSKPTNVKDYSHKKFGIRIKRSQMEQPVQMDDDKEYKIINKTEPNSLVNKNLKSRYDSKTSNLNKNPNKGRIYISGTSQSNKISESNKYERNYTNDKKNSSDIKITSNKRNLINKKQLTTPVLRPTNSANKSTSMPSNNVRNSNTISHSIKDIKRSPIKPYVLNERKCDVITYEPKMPRYNNDTTEKAELRSSTKDNHTMVVTRNVTKELKTVADLPKSVKTYHRYNYNYNPNISNTGTHSIVVTNKKEKRR